MDIEDSIRNMGEDVNNVKKMNELLNPQGFFYVRGENVYGHGYIVGEIKEKRTENGYEIFILGSESGENMDDVGTAGIDYKNKFIYGRLKKTGEVLSNYMETIGNEENYEENSATVKIYERIIKSLGLTAESSEEEIENAARKIMEGSIKHEFGHDMVFESIFPKDKFDIICKKGEEEKIRAHAIHENLANTYDGDMGKGLFPYIESLPKEERDSLLEFFLGNYLTKDPDDKIIDKIWEYSPEFVSKLINDYNETGDISPITDARKAVFERNFKLAQEMCTSI